ncbi:MAG: type I pullulanase [Lachnospiraceae bacterium]|nr:type I pullulanase [Lachnospiraceae bacterium]
MKKTPIQWKDYYRTNKEDADYHYEGMLGPIVTKEKTLLRLWSPVAEKACVSFFKDGTGGEAFLTEDMHREKQGVWIWEKTGDLHGTYYVFKLFIEGNWITSQDPYATACGVNGLRSMLVDLSRTQPEGWQEDTPPAREAEDVIYELHVKEFSWDPAGGFDPEVRGTYRAFAQRDTHLDGDPKGPATGLSYVKALGINTLQIMPMYDYGSVDEAGDKEAFNWGYDPVNYNVPEGSYSTDPFHGEVRIREAREMVKAMHDAGFRVIMDVVYNHTFSLDTCLQKTMPWYFYRIDEKGNPSNGSGCGNDVATERSMVRKYIEDSVLYWAREYHMDGFRFDLMGLLDVTLMNRIRKKLDAIYGEGEKVLYGEPWGAGDTHMEPDQMGSLKENEEWLLPSIGMFQDDLRDGIKGSVFDDLDAGFVNGREDMEELIAAGFKAYGRPASRWISYVSCHDNLTLWDKLLCTTEEETIRKRQNRLAASIYLMCPGRPFLLSGEEFLRTKEGNDNTFNAPVTLNRLDWKLIRENEDMVSFYRGLIGLRKRVPVLCAKDAEAADRIRILHSHGGVVSFMGTLEGEKGTFSAIFGAYNSLEDAQRIALPKAPEGKIWQILVKEDNSHLWEKALAGEGLAAGSDPALKIRISPKGGYTVQIPGGSCVMLGIPA